MLWHVLSREFAAYVKDGRFLASTVLLLVLCVVAGRVSVHEFRLQTGRTQAMANADRTHPRYHGTNRFFTYVYTNTWDYGRPTAPAQILVRGSERHADPGVAFEYWRIPWYRGEFVTDPLRRFFGSMDFVVVTGMILSLLVFLVAYDSVSRELESGTLHVLLSSAIPRDTIILGKLGGGLLAVAAPYLIAGMLLLASIAFEPAVRLSAASLVRMLAVLVTGLVFVAVNYAAAVLVSTWTRSSSLSVLVLLVLWTAQTLVIPGASAPLAHLVCRHASPDELAAESERLGYVESRTRLSAWSQNESGEKRWGDLTLEQQRAFDRRQWDIIEETNRAVLSMAHDYAHVRQRRNRLAAWLNRTSIFGAFQNACMALADTGPGHTARLAQYNNQHYSKMIAFASENSMQSYEDIDASAAPAYRPLPASLATCTAEALPDLTLLCLMAVGLFLWAYLKFLRMELV